MDKAPSSMEDDMIQFDLANGDSVLDPAHTLLIEGCEQIISTFTLYDVKLTCRIAAPGATHGKMWYAEFALNGIKSPHQVRHQPNEKSFKVLLMPNMGEWVPRDASAIAENYLAPSFEKAAEERRATEARTKSILFAIGARSS